MELNKGARLGNRFKVLGCLGSGKMGTVFVAADAAQDDQVVALKVFHQHLLKEFSSRQKLRERVAVAREFDDVGLVRAIEYVDEPGLEALALEYVPGGNLHSLVEDGPLSTVEIIEVLRQAAQALAILHARGIVHWDLKPSSILFSKEGRVKLCGFGLSKLLSCGPINLRVGSAQYRAPEYLRYGDCDQRGDIYSLGVIAYELLTGTTPPAGDEPSAATEPDA
ncbi:MAG: serine/threonine protein kinase, partial [Deltaproteobacteria bacterium]|nr:serine/threonine protein kinase [Deltaproteobacteria bacterium]